MRECLREPAIFFFNTAYRKKQKFLFVVKRFARLRAGQFKHLQTQFKHSLIECIHTFLSMSSGNKTNAKQSNTYVIKTAGDTNIWVKHSWHAAKRLVKRIQQDTLMKLSTVPLFSGDFKRYTWRESAFTGTTGTVESSPMILQNKWILESINSNNIMQYPRVEDAISIYKLNPDHQYYHSPQTDSEAEDQE